MLRDDLRDVRWFAAADPAWTPEVERLAGEAAALRARLRRDLAARAPCDPLDAIVRIEGEESAGRHVRALADGRGDEAVRVTVWPEAEPRTRLRNTDIRIDLLCRRVPDAPANLLITRMPSGVSCPGVGPSPCRAAEHALRVVLARLWAAEAGPGHPAARHLEHPGEPVAHHRIIE